MRLDEWQKYIDTQFLDDSPEPAPQPATIPVTSAPPAPASQTVLPLDAAAVHEEASSTSLLVPVSAPVSAYDSNTRLFSEVEQLPANSSTLDKPDGDQTPVVLSAPTAASDPASPLSMSAHEVEAAFPEPALSITHSVFTLVVTPPPPAVAPSNRTPRIELLTPLPDAPADPAPAGADVVNKTRRRSQARTVQQNTQAASVESDTSQTVSAPVTSPNELFQPLNDLGADIPEFVRYLPSSHAAAPLPNLSSLFPTPPRPQQRRPFQHLPMRTASLTTHPGMYPGLAPVTPVMCALKQSRPVLPPQSFGLLCRAMCRHFCP